VKFPLYLKCKSLTCTIKHLTSDGMHIHVQTIRETVEHVLWRCPAARDVLGAGVRISIKVAGFFGHMVDRCSSDELELFG
jgi:hypothetical protein